MRKCKYHCSACSTHFGSIEAFDAHRQGSYKTGRYCVSPANNPKFHATSTDGVCKMYAKPEFGITIWTTAGAAASWQRRRDIVTGANVVPLSSPVPVPLAA